MSKKNLISRLAFEPFQEYCKVTGFLSGRDYNWLRWLNSSASPKPGF